MELLFCKYSTNHTLNPGSAGSCRYYYCDDSQAANYESTGSCGYNVTMIPTASIQQNNNDGLILGRNTKIKTLTKTKEKKDALINNWKTNKEKYTEK